MIFLATSPTKLSQRNGEASVMEGPTEPQAPPPTECANPTATLLAVNGEDPLHLQSECNGSDGNIEDVNNGGEQDMDEVNNDDNEDAEEECDDNEDDNDEDNDDDDEEEEEDPEPYESDEAAAEARLVALQHYNEQRYEDALDIQYRLVRHFARKYGATAPPCGLYFLDFGLSQLRLLQSKNSVEAALQPLDQDAIEACFVNLDVARVCFQKLEQQRGEGDVPVQLSLAEVHNAIAQLHAEREDFDSALREYESELLTYRQLQAEQPGSAPPGRLVAALYGIADCHMKEGDFETAEARFAALLEEIAAMPPGTIAPGLVADLEELRDDAREMKGGKFKAIQASIQEQFAEAAAEEQPTAEEFYGAGADRHPFVSSLPGEAEYSALSMPQSASHPVQWNEHSNSMSVSLFPPQSGHNAADASSGSQPVRHVIARKKPKVQHNSNSAEPDAKRIRTES